MLQRQNYFIAIFSLSVVFANSAMAIERDHDAMQHDSGHAQHDGMSQKVMSGKHSPMNADGQHAGHHAKMEHEDAPLRADHVIDDMQGDHDNMQHNADMMKSGKQTMSSDRAREENTLAQLNAVPASGKSREAGYDGRYAMEPTLHDDDVAAQCAKASRGLVMIDKATMAKCGGKVPKTAAEVSGSTTMMDHSSH